jgi:hypothetical protein
MQSIHTIARQILLIAALAPATGYASPWNTPGHEHTEGVGTAGPRNNMPDGRISQQDAVAIKDYYLSLAANGRCPSGSLPGGAGCTPLGPLGGWVVGQPMPPNVLPEPLPRELAARLMPSAGLQYLRHGGDVLLVVSGSDIVAGGMAIPVH